MSTNASSIDELMFEQQEHARALAMAAVAGAPVLALPEHAFVKPKRNFTPYGGARELWESTEHCVILAGPSETGKTLAMLHLLDHLCWTYPKLRAVIVRKVRADMMASVLQTWENKVIHMDEQGKTAEGITRYGGTDPSFYRYPNGSRIFIAGLDRPGKILSAELDCVCVNQTEELSEADWETLVTRTTGRAGVLRPARLLGDANPAGSQHWILSKATEGTLCLLRSNHKDNPTLYNPETGDITEQGKITIAALKSNTGVRYKRLYEGLWVSAEGIVYETYNPDVHVVDRPWSPIVYYIGSIDWGFKNPGVFQVWGVDADGRMYRVWEVYRVQKLVAGSTPEDGWWINVAKQLHALYDFQAVPADPSEPGYIVAMQQAGIPVVNALNAVKPGIQAVESRLKIQPDGRPRIMFIRGGRAEPDPLLVKEHKPTCTEQEMEVYQWEKPTAVHPVKEVPLKENDHGLDGARYAVMHVDRRSRFAYA